MFADCGSDADTNLVSAQGSMDLGSCQSSDREPIDLGAKLPQAPDQSSCTVVPFAAPSMVSAFHRTVHKAGFPAPGAVRDWRISSLTTTKIWNWVFLRACKCPSALSFSSPATAVHSETLAASWSYRCQTCWTGSGRPKSSR